MPKPAEQIEHAILGLRIEQLHGARDHLLVEPGIDLDEIERAERQRKIELGNREAQLDLIGPERMHRFRASRLQEDRKARGLRKREQARQVFGAQRLEVAEDQRNRPVAGDEFDLRDAALAIQGIDQRGELGNAFAKRGHDRMAMAEFGHETRIEFAETDHRAAFLLHEANRETSLSPITPGRVDQWLQHGLRLDVAQPGQVLQQHVLLGGDLLVLVEMLQHASGADAEVRAARRNPVRRRLEHLKGLAFVEMPIATGLLYPNQFAGQGARDEHGLAVQATDATTVVQQVGDFQFEFAVDLGAGAGHGITDMKRAADCLKSAARAHSRTFSRGAYFCFHAPPAS